MTKDLQILAAGTCQLDDNNDVLTGTRRLAQRFVMELLTVTKSIKYLPQRGCSFLPRVLHAKNEFDVIVAFATAKHQVQMNLRSEETNDTPATERYKSAALSYVLLDDDSIAISFDVKSMAGTVVSVLTPPIQI
jgi:hypothetical protein